MPTGRVVGILFYLLRIPCAGITTTEGQFRNSICCIVSSQRVLTGLFSNIMLVFFQNTAAIQLRTVIVSLAPPYRTFQPHFVFLARPLKCLPGSLLVDTSAGIPWSSLVVVWDKTWLESPSWLGQFLSEPPWDNSWPKFVPWPVVVFVFAKTLRRYN